MSEADASLSADVELINRHSEPWIHFGSHLLTVRAPAVQPCLRKQAMASSSDAHSRDGAGAASVVVVLPKLLPLGAAAENGFPAEDEVVDSLTLTLAKIIRSLALQRYFAKVIKSQTLASRAPKRSPTALLLFVLRMMPCLPKTLMLYGSPPPRTRVQHKLEQPPGS